MVRKGKTGGRTWKHAFDGERDGEGGHQCLVGGGIEDGAEHGVHIEPPCQEPVGLCIHVIIIVIVIVIVFLFFFQEFDTMVVSTNEENVLLTRSERPAYTSKPVAR